MSTEEIPLHYLLLAEQITRAIDDQEDPEVRVAIAALLVEGKYRVRPRVGVDVDGVPVPDSLVYFVDIPTADGWAPLCVASWRILGLEWADVLLEVEAIERDQEPPG